MKKNDVTALDIERFSHQNEKRSGEFTLSDLPRLKDFLASPLPEGIDANTVIARWWAQGEVVTSSYDHKKQIWLYVQIDAEVPLGCQRCLQPVIIPLALEFDYRFVATEEQAILEDEESEEVVLALSRDFDLHRLIEDELIMALPYMPLHEQCPAPLVEGLDKAGVALETVDPAFDEALEKENPFAVLKEIKKKAH